VTSAIVTTYRFFGDVDYAATEQKLLDKLDAVRMAAGKPPVIRVNGNSAAPLVRAREAIKAGGDAEAAIHTMLETIVNETGLTMQGLALHTTDLNSMTFPRELVLSEKVQIDVDIHHNQPQGSPWGLFLVLMMYSAS
jgi:hypothetical protein